MVQTMKTLGMIGLTSLALAQERQLTHAPHGHVLTNVNVWSPDGRWLAFVGKRSDGGDRDRRSAGPAPTTATVTGVARACGGRLKRCADFCCWSR